MARQTVERENKDFLGQVSNLDPTDLPEGAAVEQRNVVCTVLGQLRVRSGYKVISFEN